MKKIFGIDLGTTYSSIAYVDEFGKPVIIPNMEGQTVTPSVVFFDGNDIVVGDVAKESAKLYPDEVVSFIKRSMGEPNYLYEHNSKTYRAEEISSYIIKKVIQDAEHHLADKITDVVITCPAYFGINEREATKLAGEIAGYKVHQILNEPTAAAIAYGAVEPDKEKVVLVYDLGGGTFDITMIHIQPESIEVICTGGDHNLGGKDWDDRIVTYLVQEYQNQTGSQEDILEDPDTWQDLQLSSEKAKKMLTQRDKVPVYVTYSGERIKVDLTREKFEEITQDLLERTITFTHNMLQEADKKGYDHFDEIVFVGGSTRMPQVKKRIVEEFKVDPRVFEPDEAVSKGAAIYGWKLAINDALIQRIAAKKQKTYEAIQELIEQTDAVDISKVVELSESDMKAIQNELAEEINYTLSAAPIHMKKATTPVKVRDVSSKSFGVVVKKPNQEEIVYNLILRNTTLPVDTSKTFYTGVANQETVLIRIMENESSALTIPTEVSIEIGTAILDLPNGLPSDLPIEINFKLNREGRLSISAVETKENRSVIVNIQTTSVIQGKDLEDAKERVRDLFIR
ncbi:MAG: Hsp70 family protein [Desulfobacterales bacterium]|nr:Hsp70 family protein [Desulfobacterales bacterium]